MEILNSIIIEKCVIKEKVWIKTPCGTFCRGTGSGNKQDLRAAQSYGSH